VRYFGGRGKVFAARRIQIPAILHRQDASWIHPRDLETKKLKKKVEKNGGLKFSSNSG
jgi:hypothetical protein